MSSNLATDTQATEAFSPADDLQAEVQAPIYVGHSPWLRAVFEWRSRDPKKNMPAISVEASLEDRSLCDYTAARWGTPEEMARTAFLIGEDPETTRKQHRRRIDSANPGAKRSQSIFLLYCTCRREQFHRIFPALSLFHGISQWLGAEWDYLKAHREDEIRYWTQVRDSYNLQFFEVHQPKEWVPQSRYKNPKLQIGKKGKRQGPSDDSAEAAGAAEMAEASNRRRPEKKARIASSESSSVTEVSSLMSSGSSSSTIGSDAALSVCQANSSALNDPVDEFMSFPEDQPTVAQGTQSDAPADLWNSLAPPQVLDSSLLLPRPPDPQPPDPFLLEQPGLDQSLPLLNDHELGVLVDWINSLEPNVSM